MQKYESGKQIQVEHKDGWIDIIGTPYWDWVNFDYREKPDRYIDMANQINQSDMTTTIISFGCIENDRTKDKKIVYDSHIRSVMYDSMEIGGVCRYKLVPLGDKSEELIEEINKSRFSKQ